MKTLIIIFAIIWFVFTIGTAYWYTQVYEVNKCQAISSNDYYFTEQDCWTVLQQPLMEFIMGIILFGLLYFLVFGGIAVIIEVYY